MVFRCLTSMRRSNLSSFDLRLSVLSEMTVFCEFDNFTSVNPEVLARKSLPTVREGFGENCTILRKIRYSRMLDASTAVSGTRNVSFDVMEAYCRQASICAVLSSSGVSWFNPFRAFAVRKRPLI